MDEHQREQPGLAELAAHARMSSFHLHRLFSAWAGVTPKDFLQCLTLERVKESLHNGHSVLDAAFDSGLSGPGRLHDLCVTLEAASPGELKSGGRGWTIVAGFAESPFGLCLVGENPRGICHLAFIEPRQKDAAWEELQNEWPEAKLQRNDSATERIADRIFTHKRRRQENLRAYVRGTSFQLRVWRALLRVPVGKVTSYGRIAAAIGNPSASRAVGTAVGANPVAYLIPCHRVIRETGAIGEYHWGGGVRKRAMLMWENAEGVEQGSSR
jgi:AraC family transcriptional regulator of adaptative response/methylated-DNA-[protein]-cysteine methyltransferase